METYCIITFESTHHAIASEKLLKEKGFHIRIIPVPTEITAGCGLSVRFRKADYEPIRSIMPPLYPAAYYCIEKNGPKKTITPLEP